MEDQVFWIIKLNVVEGKSDAALALMNDLIEHTKNNEPDALYYEWFFSDDKQTCHIHERYKNSDAVLTHLQNFGSKFGERFGEVFEPTGLSVYGNPTDDARRALDDLGAEYFEPAHGFQR